MDNSELFANEVNLKEDECCIIFDFGCYFPYADEEYLFFDFEFDGHTINDKIINHRYPNKSYQTITKKYGRRLSKFGYPYVFKLDEQGLKMLHIKVGLQTEGLQEQHVTFNFPIETYMTKDKPVCALTLRYFFDESKFDFYSRNYIENEKILQTHTWTNYATENADMKYTTIMYPHKSKVEQLDISYNDVITPYATKIQHL